MVFRIECFINLKMRVCGRKSAKRYQLCRTKADAHDKFGFWVLIGRSCNKIDWLTRYSKKPSQNKKIRVQTLCSLSLSLLLRPAIKVWIQKIVRWRAWSGTNMYNPKSYNIVRLCVRWSPHAERNISEKYFLSDACHGRIQRGGQRVRTPWKIRKI